MSVDLFQTGVYCRVPGGGPGEDVQGQKAAGMKWAALNCGTDPGVEENPLVWTQRRQQYASVGIPVAPWRHCHNLDDIGMILDTAKSWNSEFVGINLEDVNGEGQDLAEIAEFVKKQWTKPVHMATLAWVENGQGWHYVADWYAALELFPEADDGYYLAHYEECIEHAFAEGLTRVTLLYSTQSPRSIYPNVAHMLYTADNVNSWPEWKDTAPQEIPKPPGGGPVPPTPEQKPWYEKPYLTGPPVGPEKLPRPLYPPSAGKGTFSGYDVMAYKRAISRAGRWLPWSPSTWDYAYNEQFSRGGSGGSVGKSGVRGFQRQTWRDDPAMQTGNLGDKTYQALRRALISNPDSPHFKEPLFDSVAIDYLNRALKEYQADAKEQAFRDAITDFCKRAEAADSNLWTYSQQRPYTGIGVAPEKAHRNDCSSYVILAYFWGRDKSGLKVPDPSGYQYDGYGNTWDDLDGHPTVNDGNYRVGDLAHYDGHVTICVVPGTSKTSGWSSFGSEPKPERLDLYYRPDFIKVVRPPLS